MHPNDSESFSGGIGGPSDPALAKGGQGRDDDEPIRDANVVGTAVLVLALLVGALLCANYLLPDWVAAILFSNSGVVLPIWANWPRCSTPGCERYALTDDLCRDCAVEQLDVYETVEVAS